MSTRPDAPTASIDRSAPAAGVVERTVNRSEEHTSELQSLRHLVCRLLLEKKKHTSELHLLRHLVCRLLLQKKKHTKEPPACRLRRCEHLPTMERLGTAIYPTVRTTRPHS